MSDYHQLSVGDKVRYAIDQQREPPMRCPACGMACQPPDLLPHVRDRCAGTAPPHPRSRWLRHREVLAMGVDRKQLARWREAGLVRSRRRIRRVDEQDRQRLGREYLERDVVGIIAVLLISGRPSLLPNG